MSKRNTELATNIKPELLDLADGIKKAASIDDNGKITVDKGFYESRLPEGITLAQVKKLEEYDSQLISAATVATAELSAPFFKRHKDVDTVQMKLQAGRSQIGTVIKRESQIRNVQTGEVSNVPGVATAKYRAFGSSGSSGSLKVCREYSVALHRDLLG